MEALQREIDFIRDKIASISQEDYEYDEEENVERFDDEDEDDVIVVVLDDDELPSRRDVVDDDDVSDAVRRLADELNADIQRSKFGASDSNVETDPRARGYVRVPPTTSARAREARFERRMKKSRVCWRRTRSAANSSDRAPTAQRRSPWTRSRKITSPG